MEKETKLNNLHIIDYEAERQKKYYALILLISSSLIFLISALGLFDWLSDLTSSFLESNLGFTNKWSTSIGPEWFVGLNKDVAALGGFPVLFIFMAIIIIYYNLRKESRRLWRLLFIMVGGCILMLTAKTESGDKVKGLEKGADDYLTKPFHLQELLLRVKGMLKRKSWYKIASEKQPVYKFGNNEINFDLLNCRHGEEEIRLTPQEAMLLKYLVERKGEIVSRKELLENVWHLNPDIETRTVDIFIARLRKYFEPDSSNPVYFKSIRGAGYMFEEN